MNGYATLLHKENPYRGWVGLGVVCDKNGTLWDRTSLRYLSHLSPDGRLLGDYKMPESGHFGNRLALVGNDLVVLLVDAGLFTLSIDATPGSELRRLKDEGIVAISTCSRDGKLAAVDRTGRLLMLSVDGSVEPIGMAPGGYSVEMGPDGTIYVQREGKTHKYVQGREVTDSWPRDYPSFQFVGNYCYTYGHASTMARYSADFQPAPGTVMGGASGSFISDLKGNWEVDYTRGLAAVGPDLFAASSNGGILHIFRWLPEKKRFEIARRIGAFPACTGLALDRAGNVRCGFGSWQWDDLPDTPQRFSVNWLAPCAMIENDNLISVSLHGRETTINWGPVNSYPQFRFVGNIEALKDIAGAATYRRGNDYWMLSVNTTGDGQTVRIGPNGEPNGFGPRASLQSKSPVKEWTSLARNDDSLLIAAAEGRVFELVPNGDNWKEGRSWDSWGAKKDQKFGSRIHLAADDSRLWVADRERHRVLCFSSDGKKLLASFGQTDLSGNDLEHLNEPTVIAARGDRAVVFDSQNQRLIKLRFR